jgi:uncharacterized membrane protein
MSVARRRVIGRFHVHRVRRQRGAAAIVVALFLTLAVALLGALDVGNAFFARRSLQRIADLASLAAAQTMDADCTAPPVTARANAAANGFSATAAGQSLTVVCGRWDTGSNAAPSYFANAGAGGGPLNAVQVRAQRTVPYFFLGPSRQIAATATAQATNLGAFTIGTSLAQLQGGLINSLLNGLLGANLDLSLASYQSLAGARIKIGDLMAALGVESVDALLATQVDAAQLANLMLTALSRTSVADANLQTDLATLQAIAASSMSTSLKVPLGSTDATPGLLSLGLANTQSAASATISPFDALVVAAEIAKAGQAPTDIAAGIALGALQSTLKVQVLQPPVLALGEAGMNPDTQTWRTQARSAQVRLYLNIGLGSVTLPAIGTVGVNLPLSLEVAPGQAWLATTHCATSAAASNSTIGAAPGLANVCVGDAPANLSASQPFSCTSPATLIQVSSLISVKAKVALAAVVPAQDSATLTFDGIAGNDDDYQNADSNAVGSVLANALSGLSATLAQPGALSVTLLGGALGLPLSPIATALVAFLAPTLTLVTDDLDAALSPLLQLLGVQLGVATIHDLSLSCGVSKLVY